MNTANAQKNKGVPNELEIPMAWSIEFDCPSLPARGVENEPIGFPFFLEKMLFQIRSRKRKGIEAGRITKCPIHIRELLQLLCINYNYRRVLSQSIIAV